MSKKQKIWLAHTVCQDSVLSAGLEKEDFKQIWDMSQKERDFDYEPLLDSLQYLMTTQNEMTENESKIFNALVNLNMIL